MSKVCTSALTEVKPRPRPPATRPRGSPRPGPPPPKPLAVSTPPMKPDPDLFQESPPGGAAKPAANLVLSDHRPVCCQGSEKGWELALPPGGNRDVSQKMRVGSPSP